MEPVKLSQLVQWSGGELVQGGADATVLSLSTDSRTLEAGACFLPLAGERFDGHDYLEEAVKKGARAFFVQSGRSVPAVAAGVGVIRVEDTAGALLRVARGYRDQFAIPVVAVTGSIGKTTTKEMIASVLRQRMSVAATERNYNNEIGLSQTLLSIHRGDDAAVVEMGMRLHGEIALLASVARPTIGVVTKVAPVHLETMGSLDEVAKAKGELVEALGRGDCAVLNADDERVVKMADRTDARVVTFGQRQTADVQARDARLTKEGKIRFTLSLFGDEAEVDLPLPGKHLVLNALAAAAVGTVVGVDFEAIRAGLSTVRNAEMRMEMVELEAGVRVVNDAYNASPLSMKAALESLAALDAKRKVAVLGDMLELGNFSPEAHQDIGRRFVTYGVDVLVTVGAAARRIASEAVGAGFDPTRVFSFDDSGEAALACATLVKPGDLVLLKGSRGMQLEKVADALSDAWGDQRGRRNPS